MKRTSHYGGVRHEAGVRPLVVELAAPAPLEDIGEQGEMREAVIGMTADWQVLYVVFVERDNAIRTISARPVTRQERLQYENQ